MKKFSLLLAVVLAGSAFANYQLWTALQLERQAHQQQRVSIDLMQEQLSLVNAELLRVNEQLVSLDENSLDGMVQQANDALLDGWESLMDRVDGELKKARKALQNKPAESMQPEPKPSHPDKGGIGT